jgi:capsular exopolysaccharide synthesis family protein
MLQANLRFTNTESTGQAVVISSAMGGEGKSTIAANLAQATSQLGKRVLLVDADMRQPSQAALWQVSNEIGLSTILTAQSQFLESVVEVSPNLELLPSGVVPPNPMMLLDSPNMGKLINQWIQLYDLVIIDSPPLTIAADATLLAKVSSGLVMVVRPNVADKGSLNYAQEMLQQSGQKVLGMVLNEVPTQDNLNAFGNHRYTPKLTAIANSNLLAQSEYEDVPSNKD